MNKLVEREAFIDSVKVKSDKLKDFFVVGRYGSRG